jgi:hypothetical protein
MVTFTYIIEGQGEIENVIWKFPHFRYQTEGYDYVLFA